MAFVSLLSSGVSLFGGAIGHTDCRYRFERNQAAEAQAFGQALMARRYEVSELRGYEADELRDEDALGILVRTYGDSPGAADTVVKALLKELNAGELLACTSYGFFGSR